MNNAIIVGPCMGELGYSLVQQIPHIIWKRTHQYKNTDTKFIIFTRPDRFDLYGEYADIFVPLNIEGDGVKYWSDCWRLINYPLEEYDKLVRGIYNQFSKQFNIIEHIYMDMINYTQRWPFPKSQMNYNIRPRKKNLELLNDYVKTDKPIVMLSPRYREQFTRNWSHWETFYDMIYNDNYLMSNFEFILCGRNPEYIPDKYNRFLDLTNIQQSYESSLIGVTIECIKRSTLVVGSQSAIPLLTMMLKTPLLHWGYENVQPTTLYDLTNSPNRFITDVNFQLSPNILFDEMKSILMSGGIV